MKKIFFIFLLFLCYSISFAESNYWTGSTVIDCIKWNNDTWIAFDNELPYATLKVWIEETIKYINSNVNIVWNEDTAFWNTFVIKVNCSFDDVLNPSINLNYNWVKYNNTLVIEWINNNSLVFKNIDFRLSYETWNIIFKNAHFLNNNKPYFYDYFFQAWTREQKQPFSNWIKIQNSYIKLNNLNIWLSTSYRYYENWYWYLYNYTNNQIIENSIIDIEIDKNFDFRLPIVIKNSKINFKNKILSWSLNWSAKYNITFSENWNTTVHPELNYSVLISNEINLWWNNFISENTEQISYINNSFKNLNLFNFWWNSVFINNYIENIEKIDISWFKNLFNNVLKSWFTSTYDIMNNRKNFSENNILWWLWWIYKRIRDNKFFNIDVNSSELYEEITWELLPFWLWEIYIIFNY